MVGIIIKVVIGLALFVGSLVGGLAVSGRLNHDGTANIPILSGFFPEPEKTEGEEGEDHGSDDGGHAGDAGHAAPSGETKAVAGSHSTAEGAHAEDAAHQGQGSNSPRRRKVGKSFLNPEEPKSAGGHGGGDEAGHGADDDGGHGDGGHGDDGHGDDGHAAGDHGGDSHADPAGGHGHDGSTKAERDFGKMERTLQSQGRTSYEPGAFFQFQGMPAGLSPEQLNEAWQRVQGLVQSIDKQKTVLELRDKELQELADDISRRWKELGEERLRIEQMHRELDTKIAKFEQTVKLIRIDEVKKLKRYAETMAAFERSKAAELVEQKWSTERGQDEVLRVLEFMEKDAVNEILAELPNSMVQDILEKRMQVSKEAKPPGRRD